jgi:hypothetical protein
MVTPRWWWIEGRTKSPKSAQFGGIPLIHKHDAILVDHTPQFLMTNRSELLKRVLADECELCGSPERVEIHHIRKLADLDKPGRKEKPEWIEQMAARRRKTLIVCRSCHEAIHEGRSTPPCRKTGPESRVRGNLACSVHTRGTGARISLSIQQESVHTGKVGVCSSFPGESSSQGVSPGSSSLRHSQEVQFRMSGRGGWKRTLHRVTRWPPTSIKAVAIFSRLPQYNSSLLTSIGTSTQSLSCAAS